MNYAKTKMLIKSIYLLVQLYNYYLLSYFKYFDMIKELIN